MRKETVVLGVAVAAGALLVGCGGQTANPPAGDAGAVADVAAPTEGHAHEGDDVLFWEREGIVEHGFEINLGHHGVRVNAGHSLEPAVSISRDGEPVADAKVFNSLVSRDGQQVLAAEVATVYEPPTDTEPAHYAQGAIDVPGELKEAAIRYRIVLPGDAGEVTRDVPIEVDSH